MKEEVKRNREKLGLGFNLGIEIPLGFRIYQIAGFVVVFTPLLLALVGE
tara:strand:- start:248 stop:394 length:147 start_codon:yes stop_codon:yes gene_type:complete